MVFPNPVTYVLLLKQKYLYNCTQASTSLIVFNCHAHAHTHTHTHTRTHAHAHTHTHTHTHQRCGQKKFQETRCVCWPSTHLI